MQVNFALVVIAVSSGSGKQSSGTVSVVSATGAAGAGLSAAASVCRFHLVRPQSVSGDVAALGGRSVVVLLRVRVGAQRVSVVVLALPVLP